MSTRDAGWENFGQDNPTKATCYPPSQLGTAFKGRVAANNDGEAITMSADRSSDPLDGSRIRHGSIAKLGHCGRPGYCAPHAESAGRMTVATPGVSMAAW